MATKMATKEEMFLTDQALGAVMVALQKSLFEQSDIVPMLKGFKFHLSEDGLMVLNPPIWKIPTEGAAETETENA